jgi:hypothetical protein
MVRTGAGRGREMVPVWEGQEGGFRCGPGTGRAAGSAPRGGRIVTSCGRRAGIDVGMQPRCPARLAGGAGAPLGVPAPDNRLAAGNVSCRIAPARTRAAGSDGCSRSGAGPQMPGSPRRRRQVRLVGKPACEGRSRLTVLRPSFTLQGWDVSPLARRGFTSDSPRCRGVSEGATACERVRTGLLMGRPRRGSSRRVAARCSCSDPPCGFGGIWIRPVVLSDRPLWIGGCRGGIGAGPFWHHFVPCGGSCGFGRGIGGVVAAGVVDHPDFGPIVHLRTS